MSEQNSLIRHWPLLLATVLLSTAFAWVFMASIERAVSARSTELSLESGHANTLESTGMTLTPSLGTLPQTEPVSRNPRQPAPWWPALLFGLAFVCGWAFRHTLKERNAISVGSIDLPAQSSQQLPVGNTQGATPHGGSDSGDTENDSDTPADGRTYPLRAKAVRLASGPDLTKDFPWDESAFGDVAGLSSEERIARLEKQNASKVEIIKALERLVTENREKWLHQDETEARLNQHIQGLSDDLRVAVRQLQDLQAGATPGSVRNRKITG